MTKIYLVIFLIVTVLITLCILYLLQPISLCTGSSPSLVTKSGATFTTGAGDESFVTDNFTMTRSYGPVDITKYADTLVAARLKEQMVYESQFRKSNKIDVRKPTVFILWLQGWLPNQAPDLQRLVAASWIHHNSPDDFQVILLSRKNLNMYIPDHVTELVDKVKCNAAKSDIIRLALLCTQGGVWADSTMLCMMPLASWVYDAVLPSGFWMYRGRKQGSGPASWFIVSLRGSYIVNTWLDMAMRYWQDISFVSIDTDGSLYTYDYYWMDSLFEGLRNSGKDPEFSKQWAMTPYIWADAKGQAHFLSGCYTQSASADMLFRSIIDNRPAFAYKLSRHHIEDSPNYLTKISDTKMGYTIISSLKRPRAVGPFVSRDLASDILSYSFQWAPPVHKMIIEVPKHVPYNPKSDSVVVMAHCGHDSAVTRVSELCELTNEWKLVVFDKCGFCTGADYKYCRPLRNTGRESMTFLYFILEFYDHLPKTLILLPGNIDKHNRFQRLKDLMQGSEELTCMGDRIPGEGGFTLDFYDMPLQHAQVRPFGDWYAKFINDAGLESESSKGSCWNMTIRTTRDQIRSKPRGFYYNLFVQLQAHNAPEVGHFIERSSRDIFM